MKSLIQYIAESKALHQNVNITESKALHQNVNIAERLVINKNFTNGIITPKTKSELSDIIENRIKQNLNKDLDLSDIDISNIDDLSGIFEYVDVKTINVSGWNTSHVKNMKDMFANCPKLKDIIGIENFKFDSCENMSYMFAQSKKLNISDKIEDWKINKEQTSISAMLWSCPTKPPKCLRGIK